MRNKERCLALYETSKEEGSGFDGQIKRMSSLSMAQLEALLLGRLGEPQREGEIKRDRPRVECGYEALFLKRIQGIECLPFCQVSQNPP